MRSQPVRSQLGSSAAADWVLSGRFSDSACAARDEGSSEAVFGPEEADAQPPMMSAADSEE